LDFYKVVSDRRSIRRFRTEIAVNDNVARRLIEVACLAPSAGNSQPWQFIIVKNPQKKKRLAEICTRFSRLAWKEFNKDTARLIAGRGGKWDKSYMANLPVVIVVCYKTSGKAIQDSNAHASTWCSIENMLLAATAEGLGSCPYTLWKNEQKPIKQLFKIPRNYRIAVIIQLGYPAEVPEPPPKRKLQETICYDAFSS